MKKFKEFIVEFDSPQIYCDMDGVLADFQKFTSEHLGHKFKDEYWHELPNDLFYQLPPMPDAKILWEFIGRQKPDPFILTAYTEHSIRRLIQSSQMGVLEVYGERRVKRKRMRSRVYMLLRKLWIFVLKGIYILERGMDTEFPTIYTKSIVAIASKDEK